MQVCDTKIQTAEQREEAIRRLARAVFYEFAEMALDRPSETFDDQTLVDYAQRGIDEYREIEEFLLEKANEIDCQLLAS